MNTKILYLGDTELAGAASYLAAVLHQGGIAFDYVDSATPCPDAQWAEDYAAVILSDYPAARFDPAQFERLAARARAGMGLLMIGGWESFTGLGGDYHDTPLAEILPVEMLGGDDRINSFGPCLICPQREHPITAGLPFAVQPAAINGYNRFRAKWPAATVLSVHRFRAALADGRFAFSEQSIDPLLVVGSSGEGRTACYAGDVAPHWTGGLVDWGDRRYVIQAPGAGEVEIGNWYVEFFGNLVRWVARDL